MAESEASSFLRGLVSGIENSLSRVQKGQQLGMQQQQLGMQGQRLELQQQLQQLREQKFQQQLRQQAQQQAAFNQILNEFNPGGTAQTDTPNMGLSPNNLQMPESNLQQPGIFNLQQPDQQQAQQPQQGTAGPPLLNAILNNLIQQPPDQGQEPIQEETIQPGRQTPPPPQQVDQIFDTSTFPTGPEFQAQPQQEQQPITPSQVQQQPQTNLEENVTQGNIPAPEEELPEEIDGIEVTNARGNKIQYLNNQSYQQLAEQFVAKQRKTAPVPRTSNQFDILVDTLERELARPFDERTLSISAGPTGQTATAKKKIQPITVDQAWNTIVNVGRQMQKSDGTEATPLAPKLWRSLKNRSIRQSEPARKFFGQQFKNLLTEQKNVLRDEFVSDNNFRRQNGLPLKSIQFKELEQQAIANVAHFFLDDTGQKFVPADLQKDTFATPTFDSLPANLKPFVLAKTSPDRVNQQSIDDALKEQDKFLTARARKRGEAAAEVRNRFGFGDLRQFMAWDPRRGVPVPSERFINMNPSEVAKEMNKNEWAMFDVRNESRGKIAADHMVRRFQLQELNGQIVRVADLARNIGSGRLEAAIGKAGGISNFFIGLRNTLSGLIKAADNPTANQLISLIDEAPEEQLRRAGLIAPGESLEADIQSMYTSLFTLTVKAAEAMGPGTGRALSDRDLDFMSRVTGLAATGPEGLQTALGMLNNLAQNTNQDLQQQINTLATGGQIQFKPVPDIFGGQQQQQFSSEQEKQLNESALEQLDALGVE